MQTFKQFIQEAKPTTELSFEQLIKHLESDYSAALQLLKEKRYLFRGRSSGGKIILQGSAEVPRKSIGLPNHFTELLDTNPANQGWPRRSHSTIGSTSFIKTLGYGTTYLVLPPNETRIAISPEIDLWHVNIDLYKNKRRSLSQISTDLESYGIDSNGLTVNNLRDRYVHAKEADNFDASSNVPPKLTNVKLSEVFSYELNHFKLESTAEFSAPKNAECWFEGPCILLHHNKFTSSYSSQLADYFHY